jgi:fructosamine-3-kinase
MNIRAQHRHWPLLPRVLLGQRCTLKVQRFYTVEDSTTAGYRHLACLVLTAALAALAVTAWTSKKNAAFWDAIERIYVLDPRPRTISNFGNIIGELKERLHRWTRSEQYGFPFDKAIDTLSFSRF